MVRARQVEGSTRRAPCALLFSEMSALLQGVLLYASTFIVLIGVGLLWDVWRHKDSFEIAARSPVLLCLAGTAHVALVFLQMIAGVRTTAKGNEQRGRQIARMLQRTRQVPFV